MREKYESLSLATLKDLAKARGLKGVSALRKPELIERMLHEDELEGETKKQETVREKPQQSEVEGNGERTHSSRSSSRPRLVLSLSVQTVLRLSYVNNFIVINV